MFPPEKKKSFNNFHWDSIGFNTKIFNVFLQEYLQKPLVRFSWNKFKNSFRHLSDIIKCTQVCFQSNGVLQKKNICRILSRNLLDAYTIWPRWFLQSMQRTQTYFSKRTSMNITRMYVFHKTFFWKFSTYFLGIPAAVATRASACNSFRNFRWGILGQEILPEIAQRISSYGSL